eukprot:363227-Chlamydomonas_euryale.AAC.8
MGCWRHGSHVGRSKWLTYKPGHASKKHGVTLQGAAEKRRRRGGCASVVKQLFFAEGLGGLREGVGRPCSTRRDRAVAILSSVLTSRLAE